MGDSHSGRHSSHTLWTTKSWLDFAWSFLYQCHVGSENAIHGSAYLASYVIGNRLSMKEATLYRENSCAQTILTKVWELKCFSPSHVRDGKQGHITQCNSLFWYLVLVKYSDEGSIYHQIRGSYTNFYWTKDWKAHHQKMDILVTIFLVTSTLAGAVYPSPRKGVNTFPHDWFSFYPHVC